MLSRLAEIDRDLDRLLPRQVAGGLLAAGQINAAASAAANTKRVNPKRMMMTPCKNTMPGTYCYCK